MKSITTAVAFFCSVAHAGYGGMANVEDDSGGVADSGILGMMALCAAIGAAAGYFYCVHRNNTSTEKIAPDGGAIIGFFIGGAVLPFVWIFFIK